jgi:hypothetical protein
MRIDISHHDVRKGLLFRKTMHEVHLTVAFSHEEKQIIRQRRLGAQVIVQRRPADAKVDDRDDKFVLRLRDLLDGRTDRFLLATPSAAKIYEEDLIAMLAQVKLWLTDNAETAGRTVIEL